MGVDINKLETKDMDKFMQTVDIVAKIAIYRLARPYIKDWMMAWLPIGQKQNSFIADSHAFRDKIIQERRKYYENAGYTAYQNSSDSIETDNTYNARNRGQSLLDILLLAEKDGSINNRGIGDEVTNFITAGFDTTALTICYALILLAENKSEQELARTEVLKICRQSNGEIVDAETQKLEYLDRCIKESLRIFPVAPNIARTLSEDVQMRDYYIPAKTEVIINIFDLHRDSNFWPHPEKFDPDRFLPDKVKERHPFAYVPFSAGIRNCVGMAYGMMTIKTTLAHILYNFYLEPMDKIDDFQFSVDLALYNPNPMRVKFIKINRVTK